MVLSKQTLKFLQKLYKKEEGILCVLPYSCKIPRKLYSQIPEKTVFVPLKFTYPKQYLLGDSREKQSRKVGKI